MRFRFTTELDLLLCKAVMETEAHIPPYNMKIKRMSEACELFINSLPSGVRNIHIDPKTKTVSDRFELIVKQRRDEDAATRAASGISEERSEFNVLLDDLILMRDDVEES